MSLIPRSKNDKVAFFNSKVSPWTTNATAIGTTSAAVTALGTLVTTAQTKIAAQVAALAAAKTATEAADNAVNAMVIAGSDIISSIRTKAKTAGNSVYELAQIPAPATPTPVTTLGQPGSFKAVLSESGALTLTWKCANPRGVGATYQIWRRSSPTGEFTFLGGTGGKTFNDGTIPAGSSQVTYQIQAVRSTAVGPWAQFNVNFGTTGSGTVTASVTETAATKLAA